jgi:prevent-host-death family protein
MKIATVREVQHNLARILDRVRGGEEIAVTKRGKVIARIVPGAPSKAAAAWPDSLARMRRLGLRGRMRGPSPSALLRALRQERL